MGFVGSDGTRVTDGDRRRARSSRRFAHDTRVRAAGRESVAATRSTADLSLATLIVLLAGVLLWLAYGVVRGDVAIVAANAATAILVALTLSLKKKNG